MTNLYSLTVSELDEILDELDMDKSGLKADKINRLNEAGIFIETPMAGAETPEVIIDDIEREVIPSLTPYTVRMWCGIKPVYVCSICGKQEDSKDDAILHFLTHYPEKERDSILDNLVKDK